MIFPVHPPKPPKQNDKEESTQRSRNIFSPSLSRPYNHVTPHCLTLSSLHREFLWFWGPIDFNVNKNTEGPKWVSLIK